MLRLGDKSGNPKVSSIPCNCSLILKVHHVFRCIVKLNMHVQSLIISIMTMTPSLKYPRCRTPKLFRSSQINFELPNSNTFETKLRT